MHPISSVSEWYKIQSKEPRIFVLYYSNSCASCKDALVWFQRKGIPFYTILVTQDNLYSLTSSITTLPTIERYHYYQLEDTIEGFDLDRLNRFL